MIEYMGVCAMSERITLELPDALAQAAREEAERTGQSVETILIKSLQQAYEEKFLLQYIVPGATYEVNFPTIADISAAADLLAFLNSSDSRPDSKHI